MWIFWKIISTSCAFLLWLTRIESSALWSLQRREEGSAFLGEISSSYRLCCIDRSTGWYLVHIWIDYSDEIKRRSRRLVEEQFKRLKSRSTVYVRQDVGIWTKVVHEYSDWNPFYSEFVKARGQNMPKVEQSLCDAADESSTDQIRSQAAWFKWTMEKCIMTHEYIPLKAREFNSSTARMQVLLSGGKGLHLLWMWNQLGPQMHIVQRYGEYWFIWRNHTFS